MFSNFLLQGFFENANVHLIYTKEKVPLFITFITCTVA